MRVPLSTSSYTVQIVTTIRHDDPAYFHVRQGILLYILFMIWFRSKQIGTVDARYLGPAEGADLI